MVGLAFASCEPNNEPNNGGNGGNGGNTDTNQGGTGNNNTGNNQSGGNRPGGIGGGTVDESEWWCKLENTRYPLIVIGFVIVYVLLIRLAGFYIASFVYSIVTMRFFGVKKWKINLLVPAVLLALIYLVFELLLRLKLPGGLLFTGRW